MLLWLRSLESGTWLRGTEIGTDTVSSRVSFALPLQTRSMFQKYHEAAARQGGMPDELNIVTM
jgi:hypothetical protein